MIIDVLSGIKGNIAELNGNILFGIYLFFIVLLIVYFSFEYGSLQRKSSELSKKIIEYDLEIRRLSEANLILAGNQSPKKDSSYEETIPREILSLLADAGTGLWRIREKLFLAGESKPRGELMSIYRPFDSTWNKLAQAGLEINGHNGDIIKGGEALQIIAFQPSCDLNRDIVVETLRPTIYYRGRMVQMGEVIVGKPESSMASEE